MRVGLGLWIGSASRKVAAAVPTVSYVGASGSMLTSTSGTGGSVGKPTGVLDGDYMVIAVIARSTVTVPAGWTLLFTASDGGASQFLSFYGKQASGAADRSNAINVTQATANPFNACILAFRSSTGSCVYSGGVAGVQVADTSSVGNIPAYTPVAKGYALGVCSTPYYPSGGPSGTPSTGWTSAYPGGVFARRMWLATQPVTALTALSGTITPSWTNAAAIYWFDGTLVFKPGP